MPEKRGCGNYRVSQMICPLDKVTLADCLACEEREMMKKEKENEESKHQ